MLGWVKRNLGWKIGILALSLSFSEAEAAPAKTEPTMTIASAINKAGRQRMLSQCLAKFYMLNKWGFNQPEIVSGIEQARKEFVSTLQELTAAPQSMDEIKQELDQVRVQWDFFEIALERQQDDSESLRSATSVATTSERILEAMNKVTALYEKVDVR